MTKRTLVASSKKKASLDETLTSGPAASSDQSAKDRLYREVGGHRQP